MGCPILSLTDQSKGHGEEWTGRLRATPHALHPSNTRSSTICLAVLRIGRGCFGILREGRIAPWKLLLTSIAVGESGPGECTKVTCQAWQAPEINVLYCT